MPVLPRMLLGHRQRPGQIPNTFIVTLSSHSFPVVMTGRGAVKNDRVGDQPSTLTPPPRLYENPPIETAFLIYLEYS
jgi:hypothetical protein